MTSDPSNPQDSPKDVRFAEALAEYYSRRDGRNFERESFLARHCDIRAELEEFLATVDEINQSVDTPSIHGWLSNESNGQAKGTKPSADTPRTEPGPGTVHYVGHYDLLEEVGRGGMGIVYRARQVSLDRIVAVKMILAGRLASDVDVRRFRHEATVAANVRHPNIVTIFEVGEHEGQHFFSMEFVEGRSLASLVRTNPLNAKIAASYARTIAQAIAEVHAAGILHRDLKPSNVLIEDRTGMLRLTDFGLAKQPASETRFTVTGQVLGTPSYMPPEQASGQNDRVTAASDIYSIGAVLYELLTARPPFVGETPGHTAWQVCHTEVVRPTTLSPKTPRDLEAICLKCLQKDSARRYATAQELAEDLERFLDGAPIRIRPMGIAEHWYHWCRRNPAYAAALGLLTAGVALAMIVLAVFGQLH